MTRPLHTPAEDLALIAGIVAEAAALSLTFFRRKPGISWKGDSSPVTEADLAIDALLHDRLLAARPDYGWLSEERAEDGSRLTAMRSFVVDPIDGTRAFIAETDEWCISVGLVESGVPIAGVLHCPSNGQVYAAARGGGASVSGNPVAVPPGASGRPRIAASPAIARRLAAVFPAFERMPPALSLALRLAHVATGTLDATLVRPRAALWDVAAADIILREAGGALCDFSGHAVDYAAQSPLLDAMLAARQPLHARLLAVVPAMPIS
ncbi:MAG: 3'(2'),5'-bisphosphate nucleotidase CysQ [Rhizobiaceae bacterium]|nr:3'(2'),5'-bisphosphate nucleotidase CysQ [Rhizobiaceae bacterium]